MNAGKRSTFSIHRLFMAIIAGAVISCASAVAYINSGQNVPFVPQIVVSAIALPVIPGYVLSAFISNNIHDANLFLAGAINFVIYGGLSLWFFTWRSRKRSATQSELD